MCTFFFVAVIFAYIAGKLVSYAKQNPEQAVQWGSTVARLFKR